jgi:hypothetical protein
MIKSGASWRDCEFPSPYCAFAIIALAGLALCYPGTLAAQTLTGAIVQPGRATLALPPGASIYIYGMGTGGALPSGNFAQGPYAQVVDAAGQLVAALAMTQSSTNQFTTQTGYYTIGGIAVSGFKTVSAAYGANNSPGARSASVHFLVGSPAVVVVVGIAGGETDLQLRGLPGLQVDAQAVNRGGVIPMIVAHTSLGPGQYVVTEETSGNAAQEAAHMGDLIGVFVFTGGSGVASQPAQKPPPPPTPQAPPPPQTSASPPPEQVNPSPSMPVPPLPVYVFEGAYAAYNIHSGKVSIPFSISISGVNPANQTYKVSSTLRAASGDQSSSRTVSFAKAPFVAMPPADLTMVRSGVAPPGLSQIFGGGTEIRHNVTISVPAGTFSTEEISYKDGALWVDRLSGVGVKLVARDLPKDIVQQFPGVDAASCTIELMATNIPMSSATSPLLLYGLVLGGVFLVVGIASFAFIRRRSIAGRHLIAARPEPVRHLPSAANQTARPAASSNGVPVVPSASPGALPISGEALDKLAKLKGLLDEGLITREDFDREKGKLLSGG